MEQRREEAEGCRWIWAIVATISCPEGGGAFVSVSSICGGERIFFKGKMANEPAAPQAATAGTLAVTKSAVLRILVVVFIFIFILVATLVVGSKGV